MDMAAKVLLFFILLILSAILSELRGIRASIVAFTQHSDELVSNLREIHFSTHQMINIMEEPERRRKEKELDLLGPPKELEKRPKVNDIKSYPEILREMEQSIKKNNPESPFEII